MRLPQKYRENSPTTGAYQQFAKSVLFARNSLARIFKTQLSLDEIQTLELEVTLASHE